MDMEMLIEIAELIQRIESGIKHKNTTVLTVGDNGLNVTSTIVCTKDRRHYSYGRTFGWLEMRLIRDDNMLVADFIDRATTQFLAAYSLAENKGGTNG